MKPTVSRYVALVAIFAVFQFGAIVHIAPTIGSRESSALVLLSALAVVAELLGFFLSSSAKGSIAFIPYLASILIVPSWTAVAVAVGIKAAVEILRGAQPIKIVFNVSQHALTTGFALLVYTFLGGESLANFTASGFGSATVQVGFSAVGALTASFLINTSLVSGVIALSSGRKFSAVWRETHLASIGVDLLASPVVFLFAWVYVRFGAIGASLLWVPILGFRQLNKINVELDRMNRELLQLMVKSIEARDPYTSGHSRRVEQYAKLIAKAVGLPDRDRKRVAQAALLHDVGKIHEKYAPILSKSDRLTPAEWAVIREHPIDGAELVSTMSQLEDLVPAIRHHHERWDGNGYPDRLSGEQIPPFARIIALADTIDAMTSERPYRPALGEEEVRRELLAGRGTQFDPGLVDKLMMDGAWKSIFAPARTTTDHRVLHLVQSDHRSVSL